tara:strand:+ start:91 stop:588 length:498 start_codon:yes stop_codon:yes gene_type:complete
MGQEFFINSQNLEDKIRQLLPSQGGGGAGFDLSASTQIIPIIDLTESAEGSNLRIDLQSAMSFDQQTSTSITNTTTTVINNTGYFRIFGNVYLNSGNADFLLNDGATDKRILRLSTAAAVNDNYNFDFIIKLTAGDSFKIQSTSATVTVDVTTRQLASIDGVLTS